MAAAWIGFASGLIATVATIGLAIWQGRTAERVTAQKIEVDKQLLRLTADLETERHRREELINREFRAEDVLARYREPLAVAAFDLQSRLYNILRLEFFAKFGDPHARSETALRTTLFRLGQYFGWSEILRREIQFLSFRDVKETREVANLQYEVAKAFLSDEYGEPIMIWFDEQRALGELMIDKEHDPPLTMGYAAFGKCCDDGAFAIWLGRLRTELAQPEAQARLRDVQHRLCDLVEKLDVLRVRIRYDSLERA